VEFMGYSPGGYQYRWASLQKIRPQAWLHARVL